MRRALALKYAPCRGARDVRAAVAGSLKNFAMLTELEKNAIRDHYRTLADNLPNFAPAPPSAR